MFIRIINKNEKLDVLKTHSNALIPMVLAIHAQAMKGRGSSVKMKN